jgi:uncharacterized phage protein gp47/JayE
VLKRVLAKLAAAEFLYLAGFPNRCLIPTLMVAPYLDVFCAGVGLTREQATFAAGMVQFAGSNGITLPTGAQMQDSTGDVILQSTSAETVSGLVVNVPVVALTGGTAGNLATGAPVTLLVGVAGINATGTVSSPGLSGGANQETDAALQVRLGARLSNPPQGGANADYVAWAKEVAGVTRVWVYPATPYPGWVSATFMMDARANPVPLTADVNNVQTVVAGLDPSVATFLAFACTPLNEPVTIASLTAASGFTLTQAQTAATAAIAALNYTTTPGGSGYDGQQQLVVTGGTLKYEQISAAIANAAGVGTFDLTAPSGDVTAGYGQIVQLEAPTFT